MTCTKGERLSVILERLKRAAPFDDGELARMALETIMRQVEDELSGIPENPNAVNAEPDGRMYPPHDKFEKKTNFPSVRWFRQTKHSTYIGQNGALRIISSSGSTVIDLKGEDGVGISELMEQPDEQS